MRALSVPGAGAGAEPKSLEPKPQNVSKKVKKKGGDTLPEFSAAAIVPQPLEKEGAGGVIVGSGGVRRGNVRYFEEDCG